MKRLTDNDGNTFYTFGGDVAPWIEYKSSIEVKLKSFSIVSADEPDKDPVMIKVEYKMKEMLGSREHSEGKWHLRKGMNVFMSLVLVWFPGNVFV